MGKGSRRRPSGITRQEEDLRWALTLGKITFKEFERRYKELKQKGLIQRGGKVVK